MTTSQLAFMSLAVVGGLAYHLAQKVVPEGANAFVVLFHAYLAAAVLSLALIAATAPKELSAAFARPSGIAVLLGVSVLGIEAGFLFVYRSGWPVGWAALIQSLALTIVLMPIGYFFFREEVTAVRLLGVALCLVGMGLIMKR